MDSLSSTDSLKASYSPAPIGWAFLSALSWHYGASFLDPHYAQSVVESLIGGELKEDKLRQALALDDFVNGLAK